MRRLPAAATAALGLALALAIAAPAHAAQLSLVRSGLDQPIAVAGHPTDAGKLYVAEREGRVKLLEGPATTTTVLDITAQVDTTEEGGLLGLAFPDDFATSGRLYVYFTETRPGGGFDIVVASYLPGDPGSRRAVITIPHPTYTNHNGGTIQFGPDGNLWLATGDGGDRNDSLGNAQNLNSLAGKVLRIAPNRDSAGYTIPDGNPFKHGGGAPEIWALGLRNPFRFSFDRATGDLLIGDVGQGNVEEIDRAPAEGLGCKANYGWPKFEGNADRRPAEPTPANYVPPLLEHFDDETGSTPYTDDFRAITGGVVVRDPAVTGLTGRYVYGDYLRFGDHLFSADPTTGATTQTTLTLDGVTGFGEDAMGRAYVVSLNTGEVHRIAPDVPGDQDAGPPKRFAVPGCDPYVPTTCSCAPPPPKPPEPTVICSCAPPLPQPTPLASDTRSPALFTGRVARRQRALRRRALLVPVSADEPARLSVSGRLTAGGRRYTLGSAARQLAARQRATLQAKLGPKARRAARRALNRRRRVTASLTITARDAAGNTAIRRLAVTISL